MKTGILVTLCLAATLAAPAMAAPSATDVVQQYLADRAAHQLTDAYALLSPAMQQGISLKEFTTQHEFPADPTLSPALQALGALVMDTSTTPTYEYHVTSADPADAAVVLVSAQPRGDVKNALTLKIVTIPAPQAGGAPRLDLFQSLERTDPDVFRKAREAARAASSMSNMKQITLAIIMYAQDHGNKLPDADRWVDEILPYCLNPKATPTEKERSSKSLFRDPSAPEGKAWTYAFNRNLSGLPLSALNYPAHTVLVFESATGLKNAANTGQSLPRPGWHSGGSYYAFADGHVRWLSDKPTGDEPGPNFTP